jgi:hypothetical protein
MTAGPLFHSLLQQIALPATVVRQLLHTLSLHMTLLEMQLQPAQRLRQQHLALLTD